MNKELISDKQGIVMFVFFILGGTLGVATGVEAGSDAWLAVPIAMVIFIPIALMHARLLQLFPSKNLFEILECVFGNFFGKLISLIFTWFAFHVGLDTIRDMGEFMITVSLPEVPKVVPVIIASFLSIWIVKEGIEVIGRLSKFFFFLIITIPFVLVPMLIPLMDISNIRPVLYDGIRPLFEGTLSVFTFPFAESVVFLMVFNSLKNKRSPYNIYIMGLLFGGFVVFATTLAEVLVIGPHLFKATYLPSYSVVSKISIGEMLERIEVGALVIIFVTKYIKASICLLAVCNGVTKLFNVKDCRVLVIPIGLLMLNTSIFIHEDIIDALRWNKEVWNYYALPIEVILPIAIFIVASIKKKRFAKLKGEV